MSTPKPSAVVIAERRGHRQAGGAERAAHRLLRVARMLELLLVAVDDVDRVVHADADRERRHRAAVRRKAEEMAELVATIPVMAALDDSAEMVREAQGWLDRAKWVRAKAVQSALAAGYSVRTTAEIAQVAPSTVLRLGSQELPSDLPPA